MARSEAFRTFVVARAGGACEYCRLPQLASGVTFHLEHIVPSSKGGETVLSNLAPSCPGCNQAKAAQTTGQDFSGQAQPVFNPREHEPSLLGWHLHFVLNRESGLIVPRTPRAEATIGALKMNDPARVFARRLQVDAGLIG